jgi:small subunit ribosomal protein S6e
MVFKINISEKGKAYKLELENEELIGKKIGETIDGKELSGELSGYELEITGTSDKSGFAGHPKVEGFSLKKILLTKGKFLRNAPHKGFRRKKTVRGNQISASTVQINLKVVKSGGKKLEEALGSSEKKAE